jgi:uncharacterized membrane protein
MSDDVMLGNGRWEMNEKERSTLPHSTSRSCNCERPLHAPDTFEFKMKEKKTQNWRLSEFLLSVLLFRVSIVDGFAPRHRFAQARSPAVRDSLPPMEPKNKHVCLRPSSHMSSNTQVAAMIDASNNWGNIAGLSGAAAAGQILGKRTKIGKLLGPPVSAMAISFTLASVGVLSPGGTAASKFLQLLSLNLATPLVLLGADLRDCVSRCGPLLPSFLSAVVATIVACLVGWHFSSSMMTAALGHEGLIIAAALMAKNIGGGLNYIAVTQALSASPQAVAAGLCIDNIFALIYFPATNALGSGLSDVFSKSNTEEDNDSEKDSMTVDVQKVTLALFISSALLSMSEKIGGYSGMLPICSLVTVLFASLAPRPLIGSLQHTSEVLGTCFLYLFFSTAGAPGIKVADSVKASIVPLGTFLAFLYSIHGLILWGLNHFWGETCAPFAPQRLLVASSSAIGGPATSVALAKANEWKSLEVPAMLVGNIGYAIASGLGLAFYSFLK